MTTSNDDHRIKTDIELLKKDVSQIYNLLPKLDTAIDKITEMSIGVTKMLAVHEEKIANQEQRIVDMAEYNKRKKTEDRDVYDNINKKIDQITQDNKNDRRENHKEIMKAISDLKKDVNEKIGYVETTIEKDIEGIKKRITSIERWKWYMMGIGAPILFLLPYIMSYLINMILS
jgi:argininosuccinate lyase